MTECVTLSASVASNKAEPYAAHMLPIRSHRSLTTLVTQSDITTLHEVYLSCAIVFVSKATELLTLLIS